MILRTLTGKDALLFAPALAAVPANFGEGEISQVGDLMARLPEEAKIQLTGILAGYPADIVRPYLLSAAENPSGNVRLAALRSIVTAGDGKSVVFLATKAARSAGAEQDAAREALARLRGSDVDEAILAHLAKTSDDAVKAELVQAAGARRIAGAEPALMDYRQVRPARAQSEGGGGAPHGRRRGGPPGVARSCSPRSTTRRPAKPCRIPSRRPPA